MASMGTYIHANDDDVDGEKLPDHTPGVFSLNDLEELDRLEDVETGYGELLDSYADHHDLLDIVIAAREGRVIRVRCAEVEYHDGNK